MIATPNEIFNFLETYHSKNISKAALRLGITQPTLTQSLKKLESKLKCRLFHRTKLGVIATRQGEIFFIHAQGLANHWNAISAELKLEDKSLEGKFRIGCHPSVGAYTLPKLLKNLNRFAPKIELELIHDFSRKINEGIVSYSIDLGYVVNPIRHPDLVLKKLGEDRISFWKRKGLQRIPKKIFADINLHQIEYLLGKTSATRFSDWSIVHTGNLELIRSLTLSGEGIGILPERVATQDGAALAIFDDKLPTFKDEIFLAYRKEAFSTEAGKTILKLGHIKL